MVFPYALIYVELSTRFLIFSAGTEDQAQPQQDVNKKIMRDVVDVALATDMALAPSVWETR